MTIGKSNGSISSFELSAKKKQHEEICFCFSVNILNDLLVDRHFDHVLVEILLSRHRSPANHRQISRVFFSGVQQSQLAVSRSFFGINPNQSIPRNSSVSEIFSLNCIVNNLQNNTSSVFLSFFSSSYIPAH